MDTGKIVALEDRIPKLKEQRRRKANRRLIFMLFLFFVLIVIVAYLQSPLSHVKKVIVKGNEMYPSSEIIDKTGITSQTNVWKVKTKDVEATLKNITEIKSASVKIQWPNTVLIQVIEHKRIAYLEKDKSYFPVMENGKVLTDRKANTITGNFPVLINFKEGDALDEMVTSLGSLPNEILNSISEIHYTPNKTDPYHISLFMNDGFEVSATLRTFAEKMVHYPSIISQLDPTKKGIIDLEVGSYFKEYDTGGEKQGEGNKSNG